MPPVFNAPNGDSNYQSSPGNYDYSGLYSKALLQTNSPGIVDLQAFQAFAKDLGQNSVLRTPANMPPATPLFEEMGLLGGTIKLNGPQGAFVYQPIGKQSDSFTVVDPPPVHGNDYAVELIELYWASLLRDVPFTQYSVNPLAAQAVAELNDAINIGSYHGPKPGGHVTPESLFRGGGNPFNRAGDYFPGEDVGPYLSQLCIWPTTFGAQGIDQRMQTYMPGQDFMTDLNEWSRVQNGRSPTRSIVADPTPRYMHNGRALAAFTRQDELFQAYFIAYLVLKSWQLSPNPGNPYVGYKNQQPFGTFGGPDIAATLGAVAKAAINAVWWYKWKIHLRHRPEAGGGLVHLKNTNAANLPAAAAVLQPNILESNAVQTSAARYGRTGPGSGPSYMLSQAFPEGSPPHPAYPTGHGTVAGACITVLKFFFDCNVKITNFVQPAVPSDDGLTLVPYNGADADQMTVNGELHKLAHNISFGHGIHAGIHWRSDTDKSLLLGEQVAIAFMKQQCTFYEERFNNLVITKMDGTQSTPFTNP